MTNNEKVKQAINKNMASIYSALEQVGATLPEKKNLENISISLKNIRYMQNIHFIEITNIIEMHLKGGTNKNLVTSEMTYKDFQNIAIKHI